ncbi:MAG: GNAT family N-acetyltransferase [Cohnella sp.]|nr:GNAT family N-acetyltransferase [Cohnella sp.]
MTNLIIEAVRDGNIEPCRQLCDELMAFQKSKATIAPELFDLMNFDTRMQRSYESALRSHVIVAKDNGVPIGYVFATIEDIEEKKTAYPDWAPRTVGSLGFYPDWPDLPNKVGCLNNLYVRDGYRGLGLGSKLFDRAMDWLENFPNVDLVFIYISNGNDEALNFYLSRGFTYSHDVFGGFIKAVYKFTRKP